MSFTDSYCSEFNRDQKNYQTLYKAFEETANNHCDIRLIKLILKTNLTQCLVHFTPFFGSPATAGNAKPAACKQSHYRYV